MEEGAQEWVEDSIASYIGGEQGAYRVYGMQCTSEKTKVCCAELE